MGRRAALVAAVLYVSIALLTFAVLREWVPVRVSGGSMYPALRAGDLAFVRTDSPPELGQIALLQPEGHGPVLHRVVDRDSSGRVRTKGDANPTADLTTLTRAEVRGTVTRVLPVGLLLERWRGARAYDTLSVQSNTAR